MVKYVKRAGKPGIFNIHVVFVLFSATEKYISPCRQKLRQISKKRNNLEQCPKKDAIKIILEDRKEAISPKNNQEMEVSCFLCWNKEKLCSLAKLPDSLSLTVLPDNTAELVIKRNIN